MELSEWIVQAKEEDKTFTQTRMADEIGIDRHRLSHVIRARHIPSIRVALEIEKYTKGNVKWYELMLKAYNRSLMKKKKKD